MSTEQRVVLVCDVCGRGDVGGTETYTVALGRKSREVEVCPRCRPESIVPLEALIDAGRMP